MIISNAVKLTLLLLSMMTMMSNVAIITSLPHFSEHFPHQPNIELLSRLMITVPSLSIALLAPFLGHLLQPLKRKSALTFALLLFAASGSAGLYLETMDALLASRALFGVAVAILMILTTSLVGDYFEGRARHKFMSFQSAFISFGGLLLLLCGGLLSDISWRYPFGIYLIGVLYIPLVWLFIIEPKNIVHTAPETVEAGSLLPVYALAFLLMLIFYVLPTQMPFLMINGFGASGALTGVIIATAFIFNALGALTFAKLKKRFTFATIYTAGLLLISIGFVLISLVNDVHYFFGTSAIMGFSGGLMMTNVTAWMLSKTQQSSRVKSSGYLGSAFFMGQFFSPILSHPLVMEVGVQHFFFIAGCALLFMSISVIFYRRFFLS